MLSTDLILVIIVCLLVSSFEKVHSFSATKHAVRRDTIKMIPFQKMHAFPSRGFQDHSIGGKTKKINSSIIQSARTIAFYKNLPEDDINIDGGLDAIETISRTEVDADIDLEEITHSHEIMDKNLSLLDLPRSVFVKETLLQNEREMATFLSLELLVGRSAITLGIYLLVQEILTGVSMMEQLQLSVSS